MIWFVSFSWRWKSLPNMLSDGSKRPSKRSFGELHCRCDLVVQRTLWPRIWFWWSWIFKRDRSFYTVSLEWNTKIGNGSRPGISGIIVLTDTYSATINCPLISCKAIAYDGKVYVVARYSPPGNIIGHYEENVLALSSHRTFKMTILLILLNLTVW